MGWLCPLLMLCALMTRITGQHAQNTNGRMAKKQRQAMSLSRYFSCAVWRRPALVRKHIAIFRSEDNWSTRTKYEWKDGKKTKAGDVPVPLFQLRSMAQTRACAKAYRNVLAWVVVLAGFKPTPAEEMTGSEHSFPASAKPAVSMPKEKPASPPVVLAEDDNPFPPDEEMPPEVREKKPSNPISLPQGKRLYAIYKHNGWADEDVKEFLQKNFAISSTREIERDYYDDICSHFSKPKNG